jgi:hypothetical protein
MSASAPEPGAARPRWPVLVGALAATVVIAALAPALDVFLAGDDFEWLDASYELVRDPMACFEPINHFFRPMVKWTYLVDYVLFGRAGAGYVATSLLIHLVNSLLLFTLLSRRLEQPLVATGSAAAFALSPLHSEAVLWAAGRPDTVLLTCWLGALLLLERWLERPGPPRAVAFAAAALLGIGAKESWIVFPLLATMWVIWVRRESVASGVRRTAVLWAAWLVYVAVFLIVPAVAGRTTAAHYADLSFSAALTKTSSTLLSYCTLGWAPDLGIVAVGLSAVLGVGVVVWCVRADNRLGGWALLWLASTLALTAPFPINVLRHNYLPLVGFWVLAAALVDRWLAVARGGDRQRPPVRRTVAATAALVIIGVQVWMMQLEIADYRSYGELHARLVDSFVAVKNRLPRDRPIVFVDRGTVRGVELAAASVRGLDKTFFVRRDALWQLVFLAELANFSGRPFDERLVPIDPTGGGLEDYGYAVLVFDDRGFHLRPDLGTAVFEGLQSGGEIGAGVGVYRYRMVR